MVKGGKTIKYKITVLSILLLIIPIVIIAIASSYILISANKKQYLLQMNSSFDYLTQSFTTYTNNIYDISETLLYDTTIFESVAFYKTIDDEMSKDAERVLKGLLITNNDIVGISFTLDSKNITVSKKNNGMHQYNTVGYNEFVKKVCKKDTVPYWELYGLKNNTVYLYYGRTIKNPYTSETIGTIIIKIESHDLYELLNNDENRENGDIILLSERKQYAIGDGKREDMITNEVINRIDVEKQGFIKESNKYIYFKNIPALKIKIIYAIDAILVYKDSLSITMIITLMLIISMISIAFFVKHINLTVSIPIRDFSHAMRKWKENSNDIKKYQNTTDEILVLYESFEKMTKKIKELIDKDYKSQIALKESELKTLQNQINPHFLFNTLETINSMSIIYDVPAIGEMITTLADMFEDAVHNNKKIITLEEELISVSRYTYIMNIRYKNRFEISQKISEQSKSIYIPKLILQPIIENAINHGLMPLQTQGKIEILSRIVNNELVIEITDYGVGIDAEKVEKLNSLFLSDSYAQKNIGLSNVNKGLTLNYGSEYHLSIQSVKDKYTTVFLKIPIIERGVEDEV